MRRRLDGTGLSFPVFALIFAALFAAAALPVLRSGTLPLFDYPNHLARMHILAHLADSPALQRFYAIAWRPIPNLAMDVIVPVLARVMPLAWAGKCFVLLTLFLLAFGAAALHRAVSGGWSAWPLSAFLLLYSRSLLWGLLNSLFGLGLGLVAFVLWIALERRPVLRCGIGTLLALALFFAHLLAFGLYGVMVMGYEAGRLWRGRATLRQAVFALALAGATFLPALAIWVWASPSVSGPISFAGFARKPDLLFSVFDNYSRPFDIACFALVVLGLAAAFARRWLRLAPALALPLALLAVAYLAMPSQLATASGADHRIPVLLGLVIVAASRWQPGHERARRLFLGGAVLLFLARLSVVTASWQASDRLYAGLLPAFDALPAGSRLAVAFPPEAVNSAAAPLTHFPALAVIRRDAFVPTLFAAPTQQPIALTPPYRVLAHALPPERLWAAFTGKGPPLSASERAALSAYDHIVFVDRAAFALPATPALDPVFTAPRFALFALRRSLDGGEPPR